jgi:hypothetical protein
VINRFAIGDRDQLACNSDGSLDIYIQHTCANHPRLGDDLTRMPQTVSGHVAE